MKNQAYIDDCLIFEVLVEDVDTSEICKYYFVLQGDDFDPKISWEKALKAAREFVDESPTFQLKGIVEFHTGILYLTRPKT